MVYWLHVAGTFLMRFVPVGIMSAVITGPGAPVQQITTSARAIAAGSSPSG